MRPASEAWKSLRCRPLSRTAGLCTAYPSTAPSLQAPDHETGGRDRQAGEADARDSLPHRPPDPCTGSRCVLRGKLESLPLLENIRWLSSGSTYCWKQVCKSSDCLLLGKHKACLLSGQYCGMHSKLGFLGMPIQKSCARSANFPVKNHSLVLTLADSIKDSALKQWIT